MYRVGKERVPWYQALLHCFIYGLTVSHPDGLIPQVAASVAIVYITGELLGLGVNKKTFEKKVDTKKGFLEEVLE